MAFGKAVFAEALDLLEAALGEVLGVSLADHAVDHALAVIADGAGALGVAMARRSSSVSPGLKPPARWRHRPFRNREHPAFCRDPLSNLGLGYSAFLPAGGANRWTMSP